MTALAHQAMRIPTLEGRNSDRLDFHDIAVWTLRKGLARALVAGKSMATNG